MKIYEIGRKCCMCDLDRWTDGSKLFIRMYMLTASITRCKHIFIKNDIIGIGHNNKEICFPCFFLLVSLENYFDKFYYDLLDNEEAKYILRIIRSDKKLFNKLARSYICDHKYIPNKEIFEIKAIKMKGDC